jgi:biopolymer transport protein ExbD
VRFPEPEPEPEGPSMTPIIDVVFLLLIFFLVATRFAEEERELLVSLPEVTAAQPLTMTDELVVNVTQEGKYKVMQAEYDEDRLAGLIAEYGRKNPHRPVLIRGDGRSALKYSTRVMGLCNRAKVEYRLAAVEEE